jgi:DNA-binding transcriptional ArsR family regulator
VDDDPRPVRIDSAVHHRALAHPMRHRLLISLRGEPATISQLARRLDVRKGSVAHHLDVLVEAGLARAAGTRHVRGGTEQYYELTVGPIVTDEDDAVSTTAMLTAVAGEVASDPDALLHLRHVRLTDVQLAALRAALDTIVGQTPTTADAPTYGVLVGLYRRR